MSRPASVKFVPFELGQSVQTGFQGVIHNSKHLRRKESCPMRGLVPKRNSLGADGSLPRSWASLRRIGITRRALRPVPSLGKFFQTRIRVRLHKCFFRRLRTLLHCPHQHFQRDIHRQGSQHGRAKHSLIHQRLDLLRNSHARTRQREPFLLLRVSPSSRTPFWRQK